MKSLFLLAIAPLCFVLSSCSSTPESRIQKEPQLFAALSSKHQQLVRQGKITRGMSKPAVYLAMGHPSSKFAGERYGKAVERWDYNVYVPQYYHGFSPYYGYRHGRYGRGGYYGGYYQPSVHYVPRRGASVHFRSGKVTEWQTRQINR